MNTVFEEIPVQTEARNLQVQRLITIWALSEAALGGVLHAFKIPLTGIFINGAAVIIIALIACSADKKGTILKSTFVVLLVKGAVSPHTPLAAYFAVSLQGLIGEIVYSTKSYFKIKTIAFGVITLFLSGIQKIVVLTILFGENLWESIDLFANYVMQQFTFTTNETAIYEVSYLIIGLYVGLHVVMGFFIGVFASRAPQQLNELEESNLLTIRSYEEFTNLTKPKKRKSWLKKPSQIGIFLLAAAIIVLTYIYPQFSETAAVKAITMIVRSVFIMSIWYLIAGPFFLKLYKKYIKRRGLKHTEDVDFAIRILPFAKLIVIHNWQQSQKYKYLNRIKYFILTTIINILMLELPENEKDFSVNRSN